MGKHKKCRKKFNYDKNRRRNRTKDKKPPHIGWYACCLTLKNPYHSCLWICPRLPQYRRRHNPTLAPPGGSVFMHRILPVVICTYKLLKL